MKKNLLTLFSLLVCLFAHAQNFEGEIVYHNSYKSKTPAVTDEQYDTMLGTTQKWYSKGADYKSEINGTYILEQLYISTDNKVYTKMANTDAYLWNDAAVNTDEVLNTELQKNATEILGYKCDEVVLTCKIGIQKYYFNSKIQIGAQQFAKHQYGNWYAYLKQAHAVPLKIVIDNAQFTFESVATEIKPTKLDKALFALPAGVQVTKNPY